jgi:hypothetical protein
LAVACVFLSIRSGWFIDYIGNHRVFLMKLRGIAAIADRDADSNGRQREVLEAIRDNRITLPAGCDVTYETSTTLADLFTLRARADLFSAVWASLRWRSGDERHDGVTDGRQAWSRRWSVDSFFPASLV